MYIGYARISHDPDATAEGVDRQVADNAALAERLGWEPIEHLVDNGKSAWKKGRRRPAWEEMLTLIERGEVEGVIVWHLDRLLRRADDLERLINIIEASPIPIKSAHGDIDLSTSEGRFMARILVSVAQKSSDDASRRLKRAFRDIDRSEWSPPYGARDDQLPHLIEAVERYIAGEYASHIAADFTSRCIPTARGGAGDLWHRGSLVSILENPKLESVLPADLWAALQRELSARNRVSTRPPSRGYPLTRLLVCTCGFHMVGSSSAGVRRYICSGPTCRKSVGPAERVEQAVVDAIVELAGAARMTDPITAGISPKFQAMLDELQDDYYTHGALSTERYQQLRSDILTQAERETAAQQARSKPFPVSSRFKAEWDAATSSQRAQLARRVIDRIDVEPASRGIKFDPRRLTIHTAIRR